jgi:hypothetical protein
MADISRKLSVVLYAGITQAMAPVLDPARTPPHRGLIYIHR